MRTLRLGSWVLACALALPLWTIALPEASAAVQKSNTVSRTQSSQGAIRKKTSLQNQQKSLQSKIHSIEEAIAQKQSRVRQATSDLKESETAISKSSRTLKELAEKRRNASEKLIELNAQSKIVGLRVHDAEDVVSSISEAQFLNSQKHPWQSALSGGNPNEIYRNTALLGYLAQEQSRTIDRLQNRQKNINALAMKTEATRRELTRIEADEKVNRAQLERVKAKREIAVKELNAQLKTQQERYERLKKDEQQLSKVISQIDRQIELALQREREEARRESARQLAQRKSRQRTAAPEEARRITQAPVIGDFGLLKGKLTRPTQGTIVARFQQRRSGASSVLVWRGLLIEAKAGSNVVAVAPGSVVYSDWMRGFGNLLIINHGSNYLSVYANNEALFKSVGQQVKQGETIASVGNSGGEEKPGLYFELRYKGKPFDPEPWISKR